MAELRFTDMLKSSFILEDLKVESLLQNESTDLV